MALVQFVDRILGVPDWQYPETQASEIGFTQLLRQRYQQRVSRIIREQSGEEIPHACMLHTTLIFDKLCEFSSENNLDVRIASKSLFAKFFDSYVPFAKAHLDKGASIQAKVLWSDDKVQDEFGDATPAPSDSKLFKLLENHENGSIKQAKHGADVDERSFVLIGNPNTSNSGFERGLSAYSASDKIVGSAKAYASFGNSKHALELLDEYASIFKTG